MTTNHQDLNLVSFHEATIVDISRNGSTVNLALDDLYIAGVQMAAQVAIEGVSAILRDGSPVDAIRMEKEDGEILTLRRRVGEVTIAVQWNDCATKNRETVVYSLLGRRSNCVSTRLFRDKQASIGAICRKTSGWDRRMYC
jgi:hypothetical protein